MCNFVCVCMCTLEVPNNVCVFVHVCVWWGEAETKLSHMQVHSQMSIIPGTRWRQSQELKTQCGSPSWTAMTSLLQLLLLSPRGCSSKKPESRAETWSPAFPLGCRHLHSVLATTPSAYPNDNNTSLWYMSWCFSNFIGDDQLKNLGYPLPYFLVVGMFRTLSFRDLN